MTRPTDPRTPVPPPKPKDAVPYPRPPAFMDWASI